VIRLVKLLMTTDAIAAVYARLQDGYARLDVAGLAALYAENCVVESPFAGRHVGREAVERTFRILFSAVPNIQLHTDEFLIIGNRAVWTATATGFDTGGMMGLPPTRKPVSTPIIFLFTFGNDVEILHERRMYDLSGLLLQHELKIAADIQRALLPQSCHSGTGFEVAATSIPCRAIGGDFFDYFTVREGAFSFVLGDVAGKGPPAALLAVMLQGIFAASAYRDESPAITIRQANNLLVRRGIESRFATTVFAELTSDGRLTYCNAGHNPPLLIGKSGVLHLETGGTVVGLFEHTFDQQTLQLETGDLLVAYSDGVTEARNPVGEEFGEERLLACVQANSDLAPSEPLQSVFNEVNEFSAGTAQGDDLTLLVLRFAGS
jgi:hypothetical protein